VASATIVAVLIAYLVVLLVIGWWSRAASGDVAGYYLAGKRLPSWVIAFSTNATGESAWLLLGLTGMGYLVGVHALWVVLGEVLGVALGWTLVALPFKEYTDRYGSITVPDYLESRFRDGARVFRVLSFVIIITMVTAYTSAQLTATGKAFSSFLGTSYVAGVLIGAAVILYYTSVGGFKAVAYSDLLQGLLMFFGLLILPFVGFAAAGGWSATMTRLREIDPALLQPLGPHGWSIEGGVAVVGFLGIGFAFLGAPQLLTRFMSARDRKEIVDGSLIAVLCIIVFDLGAVFAGMAGRALFPGLADPETILPTMSAELFPAVFTGIYLVIVLAASMSTVDSLLILASSAVVRDVVQQLFHPNLSERQLSFWGKLTTTAIGIVALSLAFAEVRVLFWFILFAWSGLASAFTPVIVCSLFWKRTTRAGAIAGMAGGFLAAIGWVVFFKERFYDLYEMLPGFFVGLALTVGVSLLTRPPEGAAEENDDVWRTVGRPFRRGAARASS
jgi:sodium/proline symporter